MSNSQSWGHGRTADLKKEAASYCVVIPIGNAIQQVDPKPAMSGIAIFNTSREWIRVLITFTPPIESVGAQRTMLVPPLSVLSENYNNDSGIAEDQPAIEAVTFQAVTPATNETTALVPVAALATPAQLAVNFIAA